MFLTYHHRTRYSSVEFHCEVYYRVHDVLTGSELDVREPEGPRKMYGFRPLLNIGLGANKRTFNISASQARTLHRVLFGNNLGLANKVGVREMMRLLLASVGIALAMGTNPKNDKIETQEIGWEGLEDLDARWLGQNIRRVAGC